MKFNCIELLLQSVFTKLAKLTATYPKTFIFCPLLLTLLCVPGAYFVSVVSNIEDQFTPTNGRSIREREIANRLFRVNYSNYFLPNRQVELKDYGRILIFSQDGESVLRSDIFDEIIKIDQDIKSISIEYDGEEWRYEDLCARFHGPCYESELLKLKDSISDIENGIYKLNYPLTIDSRLGTHQMHAMSLGGVEMDARNHIKGAKAASLDYFLDVDSFPKQNELWERAFLKFAQEYHSENITVYRFSSRSADDEFGQDTFSSFAYFIVTVLVMLGFSMVTCMMTDCVRSKPWFGVLGCTSSTLAVGAVFGFLLYFKTPFVLINLVIPFLMLGIGLDDTFVILAAWRLTDPGLEVEKRLEQTYHHAGFSITITSLTNLISFLMGATSPYHATRLLCLYAALSVLMAFVFQLTFFGGFLVLLGRAEAANRHGLTLHKVRPLSLAENESKAYRLCCTGGTDPQNPEDPRDNREHPAMVFCRDSLGSWLSAPLGKILVLVSYTAFLGLAVYGFFHITEGMRMDDIFGQGSYPYLFMEKEQSYFYKYAFSYQVIIDHPIDYSNETAQKKYLETTRLLETLPYASNSSSLNENWLKQFKKWLDRESESLNCDLGTKQQFYDCLRNNFLTDPMYKNYALDVVFDENHTEIVASRFFQQIQDVKDFVDFSRITNNIWNTVEILPLKVMLYHPLMMMVEMHIGVFWVTLKTLAITSVIMIVVTFAFLPNLSYSVWVSFAVISTILGTVGFLPFWNVNLNAPTMVTLIISVGFCVDNAAHITYAFGCSKKTTGNAKMRDALHYVGVPISQACISTIIGVMFLLLTPSYTFHMFAKTICILMVFALYHSVLLLPVLNSLTYSLLNRTPRETREAKKVKFYKGPEPGVDIPFIDSNKT